MKVKVLTPASPAVTRTTNLVKHRRFARWFVGLVVLEHAWLVYHYEQAAVLEKLAELTKALQ